MAILYRACVKRLLPFSQWKSSGGIYSLADFYNLALKDGTCLILYKNKFQICYYYKSMDVIYELWNDNYKFIELEYDLSQINPKLFEKDAIPDWLK